MPLPPDHTPLHLLLRDARRALGITQADLARRVDCTQSAVSMMEKGRPDAMARPTLEKVASLLGVELPPEEDATPRIPASPAATSVRICPNGDCPSNLPYRVGDEVHFMPRAHHGSGTRCPYCGEVLVASCPSCGEPIRPGEALCPACGTELVAAALEPGEATDAWLRTRQEQSRLIFNWATPPTPLP